MKRKSFANLYAERRATPAYHAEELAVSFLAEVNAAMKAQGISNSELARRIGSSPAYITKVFRGPSNLSFETLAKLSMAVGCRASVHLQGKHSAFRWSDISRDVRPARDWPAKDAFSTVNYLHGGALEKSNDEKFAFAA